MPEISIIPMPQNTSNLASMDNTASIVQFLQRPVKLDHFQLKPGNDSVKPLKQFILKDPQTPIRSWSLPQDILDRGQKMYKVANQYFFKADIKVKLVLNTNPFVAGRFYLTYSPYEDRVSEARKQIYSSRSGVTAYPGVEIDVQLNNTVEIMIPFASFKEAYVLNTKEYENFVKLHLFGITDVLGTTTASTLSIVDISVYAWFENITINLPTSRALALGPQIKEIVKEVEVDTTLEKIDKLKVTNPKAYTYIKNMLSMPLNRIRRSYDEVDVEMQIYDQELYIAKHHLGKAQYWVGLNDYCMWSSKIFKLVGASWYRFAVWFNKQKNKGFVNLSPEITVRSNNPQNWEDVKDAIPKLLEIMFEIEDRPEDYLTQFRLDAIRQYAITNYNYLLLHAAWCLKVDMSTSDEPVESVSVELQVQSENLEQGIISDIASTVKSVAGSAEKTPIPIVKEIATPVKWIASVVEGIANIFGWSRPNTEASLSAFQNIPGRAYTHYSAIDQSVALALQQDNELVKPHNVFPSAVDEMDLAYVCANPAVKEVITWPVGQNKTLIVIPVGIGPFNRNELASKEFQTNTECVQRNSEWGKKLHKQFFLRYNKDPREGGTCQICPSEKLYGKYKVGAGLMDTAPCEYVSQLFQRWRATMCFKISVVKTAFHSGRLEIFFDPGPYEYKQGQIKPDLSFYDNIDTTNNYKYILDLTNDTEVTIRIPFVSEALYKSTIGCNSRRSHLINFANPIDIQDIFDSMIGSLVIRPVSTLLAPETVAQQVKIVVWKWAEDVDLQIPQNSNQRDLQVYNPKEHSDIPDPGLTVSQLGVDIISKGSFEPQSWNCEMVEMQINIGNVANQNVITFLNSNDFMSANLNTASLAMGEKLVNLRPLLRIFRPWQDINMDNTQTYYFNYQDDTSGTKTQDNRNIYTDFSSYLSYMYRFMRGGVRYKFFDQKMSKNNNIMTFLSFNDKFPIDVGIGPTHLTYPALNPVHEVSIPFYCKYRKLPISYFEHGIMPVLACKSLENTKTMVMRAGNDDLTFGWLMGTPQLTTGLSTIEMVEYKSAVTGVGCNTC